MKAGPQTSEFWVTMITMIGALAMEAFGLDMSVEEMGMVFGPAMAYIVSRGLAKKGQ